MALYDRRMFKLSLVLLSYRTERWFAPCVPTSFHTVLLLQYHHLPFSRYFKIGNQSNRLFIGQQSVIPALLFWNVIAIQNTSNFCTCVFGWKSFSCVFKFKEQNKIIATENSWISRRTTAFWVFRLLFLAFLVLSIVSLWYVLLL